MSCKEMVLKPGRRVFGLVGKTCCGLPWPVRVLHVAWGDAFVAPPVTTRRRRNVKFGPTKVIARSKKWRLVAGATVGEDNVPNQVKPGGGTLRLLDLFSGTGSVCEWGQVQDTCRSAAAAAAKSKVILRPESSDHKCTESARKLQRETRNYLQFTHPLHRALLCTTLLCALCAEFQFKLINIDLFVLAVFSIYSRRICS